jgi:tRNA pseudouridine55 synthase
MIIQYNKSIGKTPFEIIEELKKENKNETENKNKNVKYSYAGRLDPMASGLMIILTNEHCLQQNNFHNFSKIYEFKIAIGLSTDTYDILGLITNYNINKYTNLNSDEIYKIKQSIIDNFQKTYSQQYPVFSSIRIDGKPLWYYAKNNLLDNIKIPEKNITIDKLDYIENKTISIEDYIKIVKYRINLINPKYDFRQKPILEEYNKLNTQFKNNINNININILHFRASVSCGTYIRMLVNDISNYLSIPMTTFEIHRIQVGDYKLT